jgi:capsular polysaccharide biosynthesis protein
VQGERNGRSNASGARPTSGGGPPDFFGVEPGYYESPGRSARRHWRVVALSIAVGFLLGAVVALARTPVYTAESRLFVGRTSQLDNLAATPGLALAGQELAASYSRLVATPALIDAITRRLGGRLDGSVSASPIPQTPIIRVQASAAEPGQAIAIANAAARTLVDQVNKLNDAQKALAEDLIAEYQKADELYINHNQALALLQRQIELAGNNVSEALRQQLVAAQTQVDTDQLRLKSLETDFQSALTPAQLNQQIVQRVGSTGTTTNDRNRYLEMALLVGLVVGLLVGIGIAVLIDKRHERLTAPNAGAGAR